MKLKIKNATRVHIQILQMQHGSQKAEKGGTKSITVYETTSLEVFDIIMKALTEEVKQ